MRLKKGAAALRAHLRIEDRFFQDVSQLAADWLVKPAPEFNFSSGAAPYQVDLRLPQLQAGSTEASIADVTRASDGSLQVLSLNFP